MRAAKSGDVAVMRLLLAAGADPMLTLPNQTNALMFAAGLGWRDGSPAAPSYDQGSEQEAVETIELLHAGRASISTPPRRPATPRCTRRSRAAAPRRSCGSWSRAAPNLTAKNKQGRTPLEVAVASRRDVSGIVSFLKQKANAN